MLVLLHGFPLDHRMWLSQIEDLSRNYHVIVPELRGFGDSTLSDRPYGMSDLADDVEAVRQHLAHGQQIELCGLSMGGYVAFQYASRYAKHLNSLVLVNTKPHADSQEARQGRLNMARQVSEEGVKAVMSGMSTKLLCEDTLRAKPDAVSLLEEMILGSQADSVAQAQRAMAQRDDFSDTITTFNVPTLVVAGEMDQLCPLDATRAWAGSIPGARLEVLEDAGHMTPMESPDRFNVALRDFLSQRASGREDLDS